MKQGREPVIELDAHALDVSAVRLARDGGQATAVDFAVGDDELFITAPEGMVETGRKYFVEIDYSVTDPETGLHFFGPTKQAPNVPLMVWSQGEPQGKSSLVSVHRQFQRAAIDGVECSRFGRR